MKDTLRYVIEQSPNLVSNYELSQQIEGLGLSIIITFAGLGIILSLISYQIDNK